ncbi:MAG: ABC transporter ATP-binding protein [Peptoniphilaceae bacterium]|nr:ABC transporter ATP-binding protein [Peptoniphilaceae bacterium]MDD7433493.1 ABC transporter ATP-binding protein [Peptoniphilaceae bacterium]MDY3076259.1 ABC transporter ATP-binding protein [Peptoniphilaceae bacterium]MDY4196388.1 ABC transporter ATP-binding protein [Peptoniphilaceae bacterium]MDY5842059.1 ABC transporter ATP-binding protein [Peptoniphilaceae bacterium]
MQGFDQDAPAVQMDHFTFQYFSQQDPTLYDITLSIPRGQKVLIVGASGSGKSTIGSAINGLIPQTYDGNLTGTISLLGNDVTQASIFERSRAVGTVLQDTDAQFVGLTVGEDIAFSLENDCVPQPEMKEKVKRVAAAVDLTKLLEQSPFELSGGQKQRVSFAGVMVNDAEILLFDEPLANLDPMTGKQAIELIDEIWKKEKKTVIIIEHRLEDVLHRPVDRVLVISKGRIVADLSPDALMSTSLLQELGIREPLYVTALKRAGVRVTPQLHAGRLDTLEIDPVREALQKWFQSSPPQHAKQDRPIQLEVSHLHFSYSAGKDTLHDVSFAIREGEMAALVGTNGAGKSTLARLICGMLTPQKGTISFYGKDLADQTIHERGQYIGYVMQNPNQMISKPMIYDEVAFGLRNRGLSEEEIRPRVEDALRICGLYPFRSWPVGVLSFGQKKRVTIASVLVMGPKLLILDEPTAGQDYRHYTEIMEFLRSLNRRGTTIVMVTHDMHLMLEYTTHAIVLSDGKVVADRSCVEVLTDPEVCRAANLRVTSLYELAKKVGLPPTEFAQRFIDEEEECDAGQSVSDH